MMTMAVVHLCDENRLLSRKEEGRLNEAMLIMGKQSRRTEELLGSMTTGTVIDMSMYIVIHIRVGIDAMLHVYIVCDKSYKSCT